MSLPKIHWKFHSHRYNLRQHLVVELPSPPFIMTDSPSPLLPLPFSIDDSRHRLSRDTTHALTKLLKNLIYNPNVPLFLEIRPGGSYTIPLIPEPYDSYLHYLDIYSVVETIDGPSLPNPFTSPLNPNDTFRKKQHSPFKHFFLLLLMFSPHFSTTSRKKRTFYLNIFSTHLRYKLFFKMKPFLIYLILNNSALLKIYPQI